MGERSSGRNSSSDKKNISKKSKIKKEAGIKKSTKSKALKKKSDDKAVKEDRSIDRGPLFALVIMILLTIIALLLSRSYNSDPDEKDINLTHKNKDIISIKEFKKEKISQKGKDEKLNIVSIKKEGTDKKKFEKKKISKKPKSPDRDIKIYLVKFNPKTDKLSLVPVIRKIKSTKLVEEALRELIKGPRSDERNRELLTAIPEDLLIRDIKIKNRRAIIDFNRVIEENANGNILLSRIDQIVFTATQFDNIDSILIKINGKTKRFIGGEGLSISGPIYKRRR